MPEVQKRVLFKRISQSSQYHPHWLGTIKEGKTKKAKNGAELGSQKVCKRKTRQKCTSKTDTIKITKGKAKEIINIELFAQGESLQ